MMNALTWLLLASSADARGVAELAIVSAHIPSLTDEQAQELATTLNETIASLDNVKPIAPGELRARINGREPLIVEGIFLGPGRRALEEGRILYDRGEFESAIPILTFASGSLRDGLVGSSDNKDLIDTLLLLGLANAAIGNEQAAQYAFAQVVVLEPQRQLDRFNYPPKIVNLFNEIRDSYLENPRYSISIISPEGARLFMDGRPIERTDRMTKVTDLLPGEHYVLIQDEEGRRSFESVQLSENATVRADLTTRIIAPTADSPEERVIQTEHLYNSLGEFVDVGLILLAGEITEGTVGVQIYEPRTGNFSRMEEVEVVDGELTAALQAGVQRMDAYVNDGALRVEFLQLGSLPLDINANPLLSSMLLDPEPIVEIRIERRTPWYVWAGAGTLAASGAVTAALLISSEPPPVTTGTVLINLPD